MSDTILRNSLRSLSEVIFSGIRERNTSKYLPADLCPSIMHIACSYHKFD